MLTIKKQMQIEEELPKGRLDLTLDIRQAVLDKRNKKAWEAIPCTGWNIIDGCEGVGSW